MEIDAQIHHLSTEKRQFTEGVSSRLRKVEIQYAEACNETNKQKRDEMLQNTLNLMKKDINNSSRVLDSLAAEARSCMVSENACNPAQFWFVFYSY